MAITVLGFTLIITLLTALIFGTLPALKASRINLSEVINQGGGGRSGIGGGSRRLQQALVIVEVSLALLLLTGAGLMIQSYARLRNVELGFNPDSIATMITSVSLGNGVLASIVAQRTQEIGLRMALGATPAKILRTFMGSGIGLVLIGVVIGLGASGVLARFVASLLYGVSATDPITFAMAALAVITVATVAICIPARRAMKIDPMTALRLE